MGNTKRIIVNADGYGFTAGVNKGIIETIEAGIVTSTSCSPNFGFLDDAKSVATKYPHVSFGIHFNLTVGRPLSSTSMVSSLVDDSGQFLGGKLLYRILAGKVRQCEMETELTAQAAILADQGIKISHFDGHQNRHLWPVFFKACLNVAKRFNISAIRSHRRLLYTNDGPLRIQRKLLYYGKNPKRLITHLGGRFRTKSAFNQGIFSADCLITPGYADGSHKTFVDFWLRLASTIRPGVSEVYCHPGYVDEHLIANSYYVKEREIERVVLCNPEVLDAFRSNEVRLINFWDLIALRKLQ